MTSLFTIKIVSYIENRLYLSRKFSITQMPKKRFMKKFKKQISDFCVLPVEIIILGGHFFFLCLDGRNWRILDFHILNHFYSHKVSFSVKRQKWKVVKWRNSWLQSGRRIFWQRSGRKNRNFWNRKNALFYKANRKTKN